jgi:hypothetical protein
MAEQLEPSAPAVCDLCAVYVNQEQGERALRGSPNERAFKQNVKLEEGLAAMK